MVWWWREQAAVFEGVSGYGGQLAARMGKWKGIKRNLRKKPDAPLELYDLEKDISEKNNVAQDNPDLAAKMEKIMLQARTRPVTKKFQFGKYKD